MNILKEIEKELNLIAMNLEIENNDNNKLAALITEIRNNKTEGVITLEDGKTYTKVDYRLRKAREAFGFDLNIITNIVSNTGQEVVVRCEIQLFDARVNAFRTVATGTAVESRDKNVFNRFSYVEIAETSAIGRALANLGLFGNEYASANEITIAKAQQEAAKQEPRLITRTSKAKPDPEPEVKIDNRLISGVELSDLEQTLKKTQIEKELVLKQFNKTDLKDLTKDEYKEALKKIRFIEDENCPI